MEEQTTATSIQSYGWWSMPATVRDTLMQQVLKKVIRIWIVPEGDQYKGTPVYRCVWPKDCAIDGGHNSRTSLADGGHDVKYIIKQENQQGLLPVIPPRKNWNKRHGHDKHLDKISYCWAGLFYLSSNSVVLPRMLNVPAFPSQPYIFVIAWYGTK